MVTIVFGFVLSLLDLIGMSLYDLLEANKQRERAKHPNIKRFRLKPLISIIIPAHNQASTIERCLQSIVKNSYRKFEIIIVDDASNDDTKIIVNKFIKSNPSRNIRLLSKRKRAGRGAAINYGFKKWAKGELIMALDADSVLDKQALNNIARHFTQNDISILAPNQRFLHHPSVIGLLQQFEYLVNVRPKKLNAALNAEYSIHGSGAVYNRDIFKQLKGFDPYAHSPTASLSLAIANKGNKQSRLFYASDAAVYNEPVIKYKDLFRLRYHRRLGNWQALVEHKRLLFSVDKNTTKTLTWFRLPLFIWGELMVLLEPLVLAYFIYIAVVLNQPLPLLLIWASMTFVLGFTVWADRQLALRQKLRLLVLLPIMYPMLIFMTVLQATTLIMSLLAIRKITRPNKPSSPTNRSISKKTPKKQSRAKRSKPVKKLAPQT